ncbi:MAG: V-type ATP synthase subunit E [Firmicutes bacterium]|nr:V-type ATP synthase subunit E [Bacillota bacterium]
MSIEKITSKILGEAEEEKKVVLAEAQKKVDEILAQAKEEAKNLLASEEATGLDTKEKTISRRKSVADIDSRKLILQKKQELIDDCFKKAVDALASMEEAEYVDFLVNLGKQSGETSGQLIFNTRDKEAVGEKVCQKLNEAVKDAKFSLADETRNIKGGFVMQVGKVYINNSVEALVAENKDAMNSEVAAMLFE